MRFVLAGVVASLALASCGTFDAVSHGSTEEWFPGVKNDLANIGRVDSRQNVSDPISAGCSAIGAIPLVIEFALQITDLPLSFVADLVVMPFRSPPEAEARPVPVDQAPEPMNDAR